MYFPKHILLFLFIFSVCGYLIIWEIPSQLPSTLPLVQTIIVQETPPEQGLPNTNASLAEPAMPFGSTAVIVKASGEDPLPFEESATPDQVFRSEFQKRFGIDPYVDRRDSSHPSHYPFEVPEELKDVVHFWVQVFGKHEKWQYLFHHKDHVGLFYSVLDLSYLDPKKSGLKEAEAEKLKNEALSAQKRKIRDYLTDLAKKIKRDNFLTEEELEFAKNFARYQEVSLIDAAKLDNIRIQTGFAHRFKQAIALSGQYMQEMEEIFSSRGLPIELTRIPFVESAFNIQAFSSAKALGMWQFIPETGKQYLKIDEFADERRDPILATYAAATHLKKDYDILGSWPMAINAYNTGTGRMQKAKKQLGTSDIAKIIRDFKEPGYQFYSRNYYPEFLAALHVYENRLDYFGKINIMAPQYYDFVTTDRPVNVSDLADAVSLSSAELKKLNPAFSEEVLNGSKALPPGYFLKVPRDWGNSVLWAMSTLYEKNLASKWHLVEKGQTLLDIASRYSLPLEALQRLNRYLPQEELIPGSFIELPHEVGVAMNPESAPLLTR